MADMRRSDVELYRGLEQTLGPEVATALMERLPLEPPLNLATKDDLRALEERINGRFQIVDAHLEQAKQEVLGSLHKEIAGVHVTIGGAIQSQTRVMAFTLVGSLVGLSGLAATIASFF
ncbi:MAG: hypothetical protein ACRD0U_11020 [Acidimicrobiales bacterium]